MANKINTVSTAREFIDAMGGYRAVAERLDLEPRVVWNWYQRGLPMRRFLVLRQMASKSGLKVSPDIWKLDQAAG